MDQIDLSIGIVSYNNSSDILHLINSIEAYTPKSLSKKIYIIDNADDQQAFAPLVNKYKDIEYIHTGKNLGFGCGHNYILDRIQSKYHAIVNPDVVLVEDSFTKLISFLEEHKCGMVVPRLVGMDGNRLAAYRKDPTVLDMLTRIWLRDVFAKRAAIHELSNEDYTKPFQVPFAQGSFLVCQTSLLKDLGGFDERFFMYLEDADLCRRINQVSSVMYCPDTTIIHRWEKGSHKSLKLFKIHLSSWIKYFHKWGCWITDSSQQEGSE